MPKFKEKLSNEEARKLVLLSQKLPPPKHTGNAVDATLLSIEHLGYIQIDTISVIERAHHHTLWNRNPRYKPDHLDQLLKRRKIFEYWSHAAAYLPMCDFKFSLPRKNAILNGDQKHWYNRDHKIMNSVLQRIAAEGPLMAKDFEQSGEKLGDWTSKPAKRALDYLFMQGELMIPYRKNFHKVYDLTERVLPPYMDTSVPTPEEYARFIIKRYLAANGLGQISEMVYLIKNARSIVTATARDMVSEGELLEMETGGKSYYVMTSSLELLNKRLSRKTLKILSPFDNLLIQRKRMRDIFNFDYLIECYVPQAKRKYGYFSLPILWDGKLIARMDCKNDRRTSILHIYHISLEPGMLDFESFSLALCKELKHFMHFNNCNNIQLHKSTPEQFRPHLQTSNFLNVP